MSRISARTLAIALAGATAASLAVVPAATANPAGTAPVINEIYGGGGNSGSLFSNDFIELYKPNLRGHFTRRLERYLLRSQR